MDNATIDPDHPLVKSGAITLSRIGENDKVISNVAKHNGAADDNFTGSTTQSTEAVNKTQSGSDELNAFSHTSNWGVPNHQSTHDGRTDPSDTATSLDEEDTDHTHIHEEVKYDHDEVPQIVEKKKKKKKKKKKLTPTEKALRLTQDHARKRLTRSMSMAKVHWKGAQHTINAASHLIRSNSVGGLDQKDSRDSSSVQGTALSELAPCPSPSWIRGVPHKDGIVEARTAWNPSPGSHHIQELDDSSSTFAMAELKEAARKRHIAHERRLRKKRAKLKRQMSLKRKLKGHTLAVQSVFRFERAALENKEDDDLNSSVVSLVNGKLVRLLDGNRDAPSTANADTSVEEERDDFGANQEEVGEGEKDENHTNTASPGTMKTTESKLSPPKRNFSFSTLLNKKEKGPTEEEIEAIKRAKLEAFKREQAEKVRKEMKRREEQWQKDWQHMYHSRQKDVLPDGSPLKKPNGSDEDVIANSEAVKRQKKEERRKKARAKRDKEIMREQRRRIRNREKKRLKAQKDLARLHAEHTRWVESEIKKDSDLVSGKHLGVEEMLFIVKARNSEACHPAFSGYNIKDDVSRAPCPVTIMHPSFFGYHLIPRTSAWEVEAEDEEIRWDIQQKKNEKALKAKAKRQQNLDAIDAKRNGEGGPGSRKQRREAAQEKRDQKQAKAKARREKEAKAKEEAKEALLMTGIADPLDSAHKGHPAFWIAPKNKTYRPKQLKALGIQEQEGSTSGHNGTSVSDPRQDQSCDKKKTILLIDTTHPGAIVEGTVLHTHPSHVHKPSMDEAYAEARQAARLAKKRADKQAARDARLERFLSRVNHRDKSLHPSWYGMWRSYRVSYKSISQARAIPNPHVMNPVFYQRLQVSLDPPVPEPEPKMSYDPPLRWGRPARCPVCQAPPGVLGRPGCPACYETKARLPWTFPPRNLPEVFPPPFERDHGIVRLRANRKKSKARKEARRKKKAENLVTSGSMISESQPSIAAGGSLASLSSPNGVLGMIGSTSSSIDNLSPSRRRRRPLARREIAARDRRKQESHDDLTATAGMKRAAKLANSHTPMIDRKALLQHRKVGGISYVTVWVKTIPGGTCVKLIIDKHETIERIRFLFLANSGEYGPESWGYMVLPTDLGCFFLDQRCNYPTELRNGYLPGDRDLCDYGVGKPGSGIPEVVVLMVSAGGGCTELNHRTMSEMLRRYFYQNANVEHDEQGRPMYLPTNIIERVMKPRWGEQGAPTTFPASDNAQKQLRRMCKNQLRIKRQAWEADMEEQRLADLHARQKAYREHLRRTLRAKLEGYRKAQSELKHQQRMLRQEENTHGMSLDELKISEETVDAALMMLEDEGSDAMSKMVHMTTGEILKKGRQSAKRRRLKNRIAEMKQKEKRFLQESQARRLANFDNIPMYVFRKWVPPEPPPPPAPPPPRTPGIITRFGKFVYRSVLKPIGSGVVGKYRAIKNFRNQLKEALDADKYEDSSSEEEHDAEDDDSGDEMPAGDEPLDIFAASGEEN